jgi:hypothetical protein
MLPTANALRQGEAARKARDRSLAAGGFLHDPARTIQAEGKAIFHDPLGAAEGLGDLERSTCDFGRRPKALRERRGEVGLDRAELRWR